MINIGERTISNVFVGDTKINEIYKGTTKVYSSGVKFSYTGNWTVDGNVFTSNTITHGQNTVERIIFKGAKGYHIKLTWDMSSEAGYDYGIFSNIDFVVQNTATIGTNNIANTKSKSTGSVEYPIINDNNEHFIELMYRKDGSQSTGRDNIIVTLEFIK